MQKWFIACITITFAGSHKIDGYDTKLFIIQFLFSVEHFDTFLQQLVATLKQKNIIHICSFVYMHVCVV